MKLNTRALSRKYWEENTLILEQSDKIHIDFEYSTKGRVFVTSLKLRISASTKKQPYPFVEKCSDDVFVRTMPQRSSTSETISTQPFLNSCEIFMLLRQ